MFEHGFIPPGPKEYFVIKKGVGEGLIFYSAPLLVKVGF